MFFCDTLVIPFVIPFFILAIHFFNGISMYQTLYYQGIKNYRIYNPGTKIGKKSEIPLQLQKSLYLCTRLTAVKD